ncbi:hypothetical protein B484DRAFT_454209 [Ochromonadaceae sp. CCMP2298]|nr:hypothetical protein B484DRAFT_454209 [Ochromonadaceae sp. CCMP2298]
MYASIALALMLAVTAQAFTSPRIASRAPRVKPVHENFFFDFAEDPAINTPAEIFGEVKYQNLARQVSPKSLLVAEYDIIERLRELKLLSLTADSGLLEALEAKGITLSQVEKLLPIVDDLNLLPLLVQNKGLVLSLAPLLIEPAPLLLPLVVSALKTDAGVFSAAGIAFLGAGGYEVYSDHGLLALPLVLLGLPLAALGAVFSGSVSLPVRSTSPATFASSSSSSAISKAAASAPRVAAGPKATGAPKAGPRGRREMVKIKKGMF